MNSLIYKPKILGNLTGEIFDKSAELGLDAEGARRLNVERYINKLQRLQMDGMQLSIMPEQTKEMVLTAIYQNPVAIQFANDQDKHSKAMVIAKSPSYIQYIFEPTEEDVQMAIDIDPRAILYVKNYTKSQAKDAIEKDVSLIFGIESKYIDEDMMMFVLGLVEYNKDLLRKFIQVSKSSYYTIGEFRSPLQLFNNEKIQEYAYSISPFFLNFISPKNLSEEIVLEIIKVDIYHYYDFLAREEYIISKKLAIELLKTKRIKYNVYELVKMLDFDCLTGDFLKIIVESSYNKVRFDEFLTSLKDNPRTRFVELLYHNQIESIFENNGIIDLRRLPVGFSNKTVIDFAIKQDSSNAKYVNFWKTRVTRSNC